MATCPNDRHLTTHGGHLCALCDWTDITPSPELAARIAAYVESTYQYHLADAQRRGRNPKWPHVPVILEPRYDPDRIDEIIAANGKLDRRLDYRQRQLRGVAFATREEALDYARQRLNRDRTNMITQISHPTKGRAWRTHLGMPRDLLNEE